MRSEDVVMALCTLLIGLGLVAVAFVIAWLLTSA